MRKDPAVLHIGERLGDVVGVDGGGEHGEPGRRARERATRVERPACRGIGAAPEQRGVEARFDRVVVRDVRCVPEPLVPRHEHLAAQLRQFAGARERGHERFAEVPAEPAGAHALAPLEVDQGPGPGPLAGRGDVVPAGRVRRPRVQQRAAEDVDLVRVGELRLLPARDRREHRRHGDLGEPVDPAVGRDGRLDAVGGGPPPWVRLGQVDLAVLLESRCGADDPRVRALPVVHTLSARPVGADPQRDRRHERLLGVAQCVRHRPASYRSSPRNRTTTGVNSSWCWKIPP